MYRYTRFRKAEQAKTEKREVEKGKYKYKGSYLTGNRKLCHQIGRNIQIRIRTGHFLLLITNALADWSPFAIQFGTDHVLVAIALEVDHVVVGFELVELDVDKDPYAVCDSHGLHLFEG